MKTSRRKPAHLPRMVLAVMGAIVFSLAGCATQPQAQATSAEDLRQLTNLAACYTEGIDALGANKVDAGTAIWSRCFVEDVRFTLSFGAFHHRPARETSARCRHR